MNDDNAILPITCTLTDEQEAKRSEAVRQTLISHYAGAEERDDRYIFHFNGTDDALMAVARFVKSELLCCSFADYHIDVSTPYEETRLTISGPEGTKEMFTKLVNRLEAEVD